MDTISEIIEYALAALGTMFIPNSHYSRIVITTSVILVALWIAFFRRELKYNIILTAVGLYLGLVVREIFFYQILLFLPDGRMVFLSIDLIIRLWAYALLVGLFFWFKFFVRGGWGKPLLVYCMSATIAVLADKSTWLVDAAGRELGILAMLEGNLTVSLFMFTLVFVIFSVAVYVFLSPRLSKLKSQHIKWVWVSMAAFFLLFDFNDELINHIYFLRNDLWVDPLDPVYLYFVAVLLALFILVFALMLAILDNIHKNTRLQHEGALKDQLLDMQRAQYTALAENAEVVRQQQHDLRHQLAVIKKYNESSEQKGLEAYLDELNDKIPAPNDKILCENYAVNAVALHYIAIAESAGIDVSVQLSVPLKTGRILDSDLCIIVGNLLENATEACGRMDGVERFIRMNMSAHYDTLTITTDNSYDGKSVERDGVYYSIKREGVSVGFGLASVHTVARKYGGDARFEAKDNVFMSSVYVEM